MIMWDEEKDTSGKPIKVIASHVEEDEETMTITANGRTATVSMDHVHKILRKVDKTVEVTIDAWVARKERLA